MSRIRVLELVGNAVVGGMETFVARFCEHLVADGRFEVVCLCPYESSATYALRDLGCTVHVCPLPDEPVWRGIEYATALVLDEGIDVIHAHLTNAHLLAGLVGRLTGTPVLATLHGRDIATADLVMHRLGDTHLHVVSHATLYQALAAGVRRDRVDCVINGVDATRFSPEGPRGVLRRACGLDPAVPLVGFVGRLSGEKGPDVFVRAAALVLEGHPTAHAVMIGDGSMRDDLDRAIAALPCASRFHLTGLRDDVSDCLRDLALMLSTSYSEGTPLAVLEAQSTGVPVIAMHVGGLPEIVVMGETGVLVAPGDVATMARATLALLDDDERRRRFGATAREKMVDRFSVAARNAQVAALLERLVGPTAAALRVPRTATTLASVGADGSRRRTP